MEIPKFFIAGVKFHDLKKVIADLSEGDELELVPEPTNKYDPNAVAIYFNDEHIGYVPKKFSAEIAGMLELDEDAVVCIATAVNPQAKMWEMLEVEISTISDEELDLDDPEDDEFETDFDDNHDLEDEEED